MQAPINCKEVPAVEAETAVVAVVPLLCKIANDVFSPINPTMPLLPAGRVATKLLIKHEPKSLVMFAEARVAPEGVGM
jgi:hypothetical protein